MTKLAFIDTETTGLDPERHEVYEIGLILRDTEVRPDKEFRWWLPVDLAKADPMALSIGRFFERRPSVTVHSRTPRVWWPGKDGVIEETHDATDWGLFPETLMGLTAGAHLVGAVPSFDASFLSRLLRANGCCPAWHYHLVDVEALAAGHLAVYKVDPPSEGYEIDPVPPWDSTDLSRAVGVEPKDFDRHTALGDARWARAIYDAVIG